MWTNCSKKYYIPWVIRINGEIYDKLNLTNKRLLISLDSSSIGDTVAWTPYAVEFAKKHNCKVVMSTFHNEWFEDNEFYSDIEFMLPGQTTPCYASYKIGWYRDDNNGWENYDKYPNQVNIIPLQQTDRDWET